MTTRVLIVEDDAITRNALAAGIDSEPDLEVLAAVGSCADCRLALRRQIPDVALIDLGLPDGSGLTLIGELVALSRPVMVMVISVFGDETRVVAAIRAGAAGYLLKDDPTREIAGAIRELIAGGSPISPMIARHLVDHFHAATRRPATAEGLSDQETSVLGLAAKGFTYAEIGRMLGLSPNTVSTYTKRIYEKLAVNSRAEAVYEATRLGLVPPAR